MTGAGDSPHGHGEGGGVVVVEGAEELLDGGGGDIGLVEGHLRVSDDRKGGEGLAAEMLAPQLKIQKNRRFASLLLALSHLVEEVVGDVGGADLVVEVVEYPVGPIDGA